jgi:hypothetical protein
MNTPPFLGKLSPDPIGVALGTNYQRFTTDYGLHGLVKISGNRLEILAVHSDYPERGYFREFIKAAKQNFKTICIWHVNSIALDYCLPRYGFRPWSEKQLCQGEWETLTGYRWDE